jgi:hypothetical protein
VLSNNTVSNSPDYNNIDKSMLKFQEDDDTRPHIKNNNEEKHCLTVLQTVFDSTNVSTFS